ncbi:MAG TPA: ribonuclease HII [Candidatus Hydrogenedentes bacterium]|nr:ribonuclease HII [Candidatus Hydrogenedentota bacterium]HOL75394.1 ribonuclease HII [Candidatus Hydrogenedentota bacterium]HPO84903.1 ribonuclease HII [Candidatus Hydrogenedentota bacterium]
MRISKKFDSCSEEELTRINSLLSYESETFALGYERVAGVDEAGRGPIAGPIVAAAVILVAPLPGLNDSKKLTPTQRERLFYLLHREGNAIGVSSLDADFIDRVGIQSANYMVMIQAAAKLDPAPDFLLVDGFAIPGCRFPHKAIVKGDQLSLSIAAASIVAKVVRDRMMNELDRRYPQYGFAKHKGYATKEHLAALRRFGPSPIHRKSFAPLSQSPQLEFPS